MTKLIFTSVLWFVFACKPEMVGKTDANISSLEVSPCWTDEEAIKQLETIRKKVEGGKDFAALARQYSEDPGSSDHGGNLGWTEKGMLVPEYENAMLALQPGKMSNPIKTKFGYHLIRLEEIDGEQERYHTSHILLRSCE